MATMGDRTSRPAVTARRDACWARICATGGAGVWAGLALLARAGICRVGGIELLFLFAPLVVVPLGMALGRVMEFSSSSRPARENSSTTAIDWFVARLQPVAAATAVIALLLPPGHAAGGLACTWLFLCLFVAVSAAAGSISAMASGRIPPLWEWALLIAKIDLAVGGAWFLASRLGMGPFRTPEPIALLTAVHFHFAGFATATIAAAAGQFAASRGQGRWLRFLIPVVVGTPWAVTVGFVTLPALKMGAALLFGISAAGRIGGRPAIAG